MSNEKKNSNNSSLPLVIIGLVLIAAVGAGWWFYTQSKTPPKRGGNTNTSVANAAKTPAQVTVMGAQPPNMLGSPNSSVTVEEFADFQCPTCGVMHPKM
jgi:protein-disulfide isomerase